MSKFTRVHDPHRALNPKGGMLADDNKRFDQEIDRLKD